MLRLRMIKLGYLWWRISGFEKWRLLSIVEVLWHLEIYKFIFRVKATPSPDVIHYGVLIRMIIAYLVLNLEKVWAQRSFSRRIEVLRWKMWLLECYYRVDFLALVVIITLKDRVSHDMRLDMLHLRLSFLQSLLHKLISSLLSRRSPNFLGEFSRFKLLYLFIVVW